MRSLKGEASCLQRQKDDWYVASQANNTASKRTRIAEPCTDRQVKRKLCYVRDTDSDDDDAVVERCTKEKPERVGSRVNMEDKDYVAFLEMLSANKDFYGESGDYCLDFPPKDPVENGGFLKSLGDDVDPHYKIFLENTKEDGSSYGFEMAKEDGTKVFLRYEGMEDTPNQDDEDQLDDDTPCEETRNDSNERMVPKMEPLDDGFTKSSELGGEKTGLAAPHWFLSHCKPGTISSADKSYLMFLDHLWVDGDSFTYMNGDNIVKYCDDDEVVTGSKEPGEKLLSSGNGMQFRPNSNQKRTSKTAMHDDDMDTNSVQVLDENTVKVHYGYGTSFKKHLREILEKPFDKKELKAKYSEAQKRKPMERIKIMRGREVDYPIEQRRKSYLARHPDLEDMLNDALQKSDRRRALALLRCLFYYYENLSHEGSFAPWKNPQGWLHDMICCCPDRDDLNCPVKKYRTSHGKWRSLNPTHR